MDNYAAGIVLYNPKIDRLKENIEAIIPQVKILYCYNNGLGNTQPVMKLLNSYSNIVVFGRGNN